MVNIAYEWVGDKCLAGVDSASDVVGADRRAGAKHDATTVGRAAAVLPSAD
jgi:hypothetical protein